LSPLKPERLQGVVCHKLSLALNLTLGYAQIMNVNKAASLMGRKSAEARAKKWGKEEFVRRMQEWGKLGGRPRVSGRKKKSKRGEK